MDLQYIQFSDALSVVGAEEIPDLEPRSLQIVGLDFRNTKEVLINGFKSPSFVISSKKTIIAQVPSGATKDTITSISVLSSDFTATIKSKIEFLIGNDPKLITGLKAMIQMFLKILLTTPGSDSFAQKIGGNVLKNIGQTFGLSEGSTIVSDFAIAVSRAETQMRGLQSSQSRLPDDERLLSANLLNVKFDVATSALVARVEMIAQSGTMAITNLEL